MKAIRGIVCPTRSVSSRLLLSARLFTSSSPPPRENRTHQWMASLTLASGVVGTYWWSRGSWRKGSSESGSALPHDATLATQTPLLVHDPRFADRSSVWIPALMFVNGAMFAAWRVPALHSFLLRHFANSIRNTAQGRVYTLLTSAFSHPGLFHLVFNLIGLHSFGSPLVEAVGVRHTALLFAGGAVAGSFVSDLHALVTRTLNVSVGASGGVMALITAATLLNPSLQLSFIAFPFFPIAADVLLPLLVTIDAIGALFQHTGKTRISHTGHLGGVLFGYLLWKWYTSKCPQGTTPNGVRKAGRDVFYHGSLHEWRMHGGPGTLETLVPVASLPRSAVRRLPSHESHVWLRAYGTFMEDRLVGRGVVSIPAAHWSSRAFFDEGSRPVGQIKRAVR